MAGAVIDRVVGFFVSEAVEQVATAAVKGAITGCIVGAAVAAIKGDDVEKGAIRGALIGGVTAGVTKGLAYASYASTGLGSDPGSVNTGMDDSTGISPPSEAVKTVAEPVIDVEIQKREIAAATKEASKEAAAAQASRDKIYSGIGQGLASGVGAVGASMIESKRAEKQSEKEIEAQRESERLRYSQESERIAGNVPGQFEAETSRSEIPAWWNRHLVDERLNKGLLEPTRA